MVGITAYVQKTGRQFEQLFDRIMHFEAFLIQKDAVSAVTGSLKTYRFQNATHSIRLVTFSSGACKQKALTKR